MDDHPPSRERTTKILRQCLESWQLAGVEQIPCHVNPAQLAAAASSVATTQRPPEPGDAPVSAQRKPPATKSATAATDRPAQLAIIAREVAACQRCTELAKQRTQTVFGVGDPNARLCFFGEAPGADEDRQGEPFVGRAGRLLTDIIQKGMGLRREDVFILNVLKCRPPGNRTPLPDEVENCREYFERQFDVLQPEFICCLGAVAAKALLQTNRALGSLRGRWHEYRGSKVVVTYHPSYLLRFPSEKAKTWEDIQMLMAEMGLPMPGNES